MERAAKQIPIPEHTFDFDGIRACTVTGQEKYEQENGADDDNDGEQCHPSREWVKKQATQQSEERRNGVRPDVTADKPDDRRNRKAGGDPGGDLI